MYSIKKKNYENPKKKKKNIKREKTKKGNPNPVSNPSKTTKPRIKIFFFLIFKNPPKKKKKKIH